MEVGEELVPYIEEMLLELSEFRLGVCLVPNQDPDKTDRMLRAAVSQNPQWYRDLCNAYPCTRSKARGERKDYTKIKRQYILLVLERLVRLKKSTSKYAEYLIDQAKLRYRSHNQITPWADQF